jgi:hypothetical protein
MRPTLFAFIAVILIYAGLCGYLYANQRAMIYHPELVAAPRIRPAMTIPTDAGPVLVSTRERDCPKAAIYFGGNADDVAIYAGYFAMAFPDRALYLLHYRGYGGSAGSPSESALLADARALYDRVHALHPEIVPVGRSLGSGIAVHLASERPVEKLILVTPYHSLQGIAAEQFPWAPVRLLMRDKYESWKYAAEVTAPTRLIVAERDEIIPRASSERLRAAFKKVQPEYVIVARADHNTISDSRQYLDLLGR